MTLMGAIEETHEKLSILGIRDHSHGGPPPHDPVATGLGNVLLISPGAHAWNPGRLLALSLVMRCYTFVGHVYSGRSTERVVRPGSS